jgi:uncharacterized protein YjbJ (UPF0337 family)
MPVLLLKRAPAVRAIERRGLLLIAGVKRRKQMEQSTKDQIKGNLHKLKGEIKEKAGQLTNNSNLAAEGQSEQLAGKVQKKVGQIEKVFEK